VSPPEERRPPVAILCGGRGTRLQEHTREIPKPLVEIGGMPILWHVIGLYAAQGFDSFLLATGYKGELIERFVAECDWPSEIAVHCVPTGLDTPTGGRIKMLEQELGGQPFCATYADGLADIDLAGLLDFHAGHGALASMTVVRPLLQFGVAELDESGSGDDESGSGEGGASDRVLGFSEKPRSEHWINGGFFCFQPEAMSYLRPDSILEREPLASLAADGQLRAHRHEGFWECMDTYKDAVALNDLWAGGDPPWHPWGRQGGARGEGRLGREAGRDGIAIPQS
jgi:glucose-1-phosphate cytidylyltransferase